MIAHYLQNPLIETFGWTLLHSLWQLSLIAAVTAVLLALLRRASANTRYLLCIAALALGLALPVATFIRLLPAPHPVTQPPSAVAMPPSPQLPVTNYQFPTPVPALPLPTIENQKSIIENLLPYLVLAYFTGALLLSLRLFLGYCRLRQLRSSAIPAPTHFQSLAATLLRRLAISRPVQILQSALVEVPTVIGHLRPLILFPISTISGLTPDQLSALLAHELAHIRRHDYLLNLLQTLIETLLFYHPAIWWLSAKIRQEREHCCDDLALSLTTDPLTYARALAQMESLRTAPSLSLAANATPLLPRIRRILQMQTPAPHRNARFLTVTLPILITLLLATLVYFGCNHPSTRNGADTQASAFTVVRVFDIRDLISDPKRQANPPLFGLTTQPAATQPDKPRFGSDQLFDEDESDKPRQRQIAHIIQAVKEAVAPDSWRDLGRIRELNGQLLVNQTIENQKAVYRMIQQLRADASVQISFDIRYLLVDNDTFQKLKLPARKERSTAEGILTNDQYNDLLKTTQESAKTLALDCPRITAFSCQDACVAVTGQRNYVAGFQQKVDAQTKVVTTVPQVRNLITGMSAEIFATVSPDRHHVAVQANLQISQLEKMLKAFLPENPKLFVELPHVRTASMATSATIPDGQTYVIDIGRVPDNLFPLDIPGLERLAKERIPNNAPSAWPHLLILLRPKIITQNEIPSPTGLPNPAAGTP